MKAFAAFVVDKRKYVLVLYVLLIAAGIVGLFYTNVNYDMSKYLPSDSSVKEGMAVMDEEFGSLSSITVMFTGLDESERQTVRQALAQVENVKSVAYTAGDDAYDRGENAKYVLTIGAGTYSDEAREVLRTLRTQFSDYDVSYSGAVADNDLLITTLTEEIPVIVLIAAVVILLILFCLCESWLEPLLFVGCIGIAVVLNMGSNAFLPSVSFMTFAVGALLQVGLSMDYSIMLMNRYALERQSEPDPASAMKKALAGAFGAITSSSVTTIVGLLALLFMSFAIGRDMGIVLAKGVLISLLCIFTALPGMIVKLDGPLRRTQKKALHFPTAPLMRFVARARFILIPAVAAVVVGAFFLKDGVPVNYIKMFDNPDQEKIEAVFGLENQTVVLYDKNTPDEAVRSFIEALEAREDVRSVEDYSNTVGLPLTYSELADRFRNAESEGKKHLTGYIVFSQESFNKPYDERSRTYAVSSDNKAFKAGLGGYSIYGSCLDGSDPCVRLDGYMRGENAWKIEKCYLKEASREMLDIICGKFFICHAPYEAERFQSLPPDLAEKYREKFQYPERFARINDKIVAVPFKPAKADRDR